MTIDQAAILQKYPPPKYVLRDTWLEYIGNVASESTTQEQAEETIKDYLAEWLDSDY